MVMAVMGGPPKRTLLTAGGSPKSHDGLEEPAGLVSAVGEVPVVDARDGEHAGVIHEKAHRDGGPADPRQESQKTDDMHAEKGDAAGPVDLFIDRKGPQELLLGVRYFDGWVGGWG